MTRTLLLCLTWLAVTPSCGFPRPPPLDNGDAGAPTDGSPGDGSSGNAAIELTLLAGDIGGRGNADGPGVTARFASPTGVAVDSSGNAYVADFDNSAIRKITAASVVTTLARGSAGFLLPQGVAVDGDGNVYVADQTTSMVSKITPAGVVTPIAGVGASPVRREALAPRRTGSRQQRQYLRC